MSHASRAGLSMLSVNSPVGCQAMFEPGPESWIYFFFFFHEEECSIRLHFALLFSLSLPFLSFSFLSLSLFFLPEDWKQYLFPISSVIQCPSVFTRAFQWRRKETLLPGNRRLLRSANKVLRTSGARS